MVTTNNDFAGANFEYTGTNCTATGEYRVEGGSIKRIEISGRYVDGGETYAFFADKNDQGNVNISGVPPQVLSPVADKVVSIIEEVEGVALPKSEE